MKTSFLFLFMALQTIGLAQDGFTVKNLFTTENVQSIPNYFSKNVDLDIPKAKGTYDKGQAKIIFSKFMNNHSINSYKKKHSGGGNGRANFEIGVLNMDEVTYRTYLLYTIKNKEVAILELRIEKE